MSQGVAEGAGRGRGGGRILVNVVGILFEMHRIPTLRI